jgi:hypothetical protein
MLGHHLAEGGDLGVQRGDHVDLAGGDHGECGLHRWWLPQRRSAQRFLNEAVA